MRGHRVRRAARAAAIACSFLLLFAIVAFAQQRTARQNAPGQFDFYVLALSWSPSYCESASSARPTASRTRNAAGGRLPSWCTACGRNTSRASRPIARCRRRGSTAPIVTGMLDLMPSPRLIYPRMGSPRHLLGAVRRTAYFETVRKARAVVKIPADYLDPPRRSPCRPTRSPTPS